ncbi:MAG: hypothetical protein HY819_04675 [Acidobacteria bacterium]|nr:hypothetical protein [Acidobacteriota bacterium]
MNPDLERLIALQNLDSKIQELKAQINTIPAERERIEARFNDFSATHTATRTRLDKAKAEQRQLNHELEDVQARHEKYKKDLMKVRNDKEYTVCLREIDSSKKEISLMETKLLQLMEEIEKLEKEVAQYTPEIAERRQVADKELALCDQELGEAQKTVDLQTQEREALLKAINRSLLSRYEKLSKRSGSALSEAKNGACSTCRMTIRPQMLSEIRRGDQLIDCENCSRILYYIPPTESVANAE